jgi:ArsR family transcriptional regulator
MTTLPSLEELNLLHRKICIAVGDPKRILIMYTLHEQPRHVTALAKALKMPQPTVSRHLGILRQRALVKAERNGQAVVYSLADDRIITVLDIMRDLLRETLEQELVTLDESSA